MYLSANTVLRLDGLTNYFFQRCGDIIKDNMLKVFDEFYLSRKIGISTSPTFITLMPKND